MKKWRPRGGRSQSTSSPLSLPWAAPQETAAPPARLQPPRPPFAAPASPGGPTLGSETPRFAVSSLEARVPSYQFLKRIPLGSQQCHPLRNCFPGLSCLCFKCLEWFPFPWRNSATLLNRFKRKTRYKSSKHRALTQPRKQ